MYYVKLQNGDQVVKIAITDDNVYADCAICEEEIKVGLEEEIRRGGGLNGTITYCKECYDAFIKE